LFKVLLNAWKVADIRKRLVYIIIVLLVYRLGDHVLLPGINLATFLTGTQTDLNSQANNLFALIAGGGIGSVFAMGIAPYINSSIIMQLLTVAIPKLEQIQKEGEEGRKKIGQYTRYLAVALSLLQAAGTVYTYKNQNLFLYNNWLVYIMAALGLVTGTIFIMWMGEILTERGVGNGASFIIFSNILSKLPSSISYFTNYAVNDIMRWILVAVCLVLFLAVIVFVVLVASGERRIPVQNSRKMVGRQMYGGQSSFIPIKVNIAGVMSIIFAISLLQFPSVIHNIWQNNGILNWIVGFVNLNNADNSVNLSGTIIYVVLIFFFTFFYTSFAINPVEMAENLKKSGGFIPGIRPGKPTSDYISKTIERLSWTGGMAYAIIALVPILFQGVFGIHVGFGGTTLLIVTGVALEFVKQLEAQLLMRHYKGFLA